MTRLLHKILISGLSLTLFTGVAAPVIGQADTSTTTTPTDTTSTTTYTIGTAELPYNVIVDSQGNTHHDSWYPQESQPLSAATIQDPSFSSDFVKRNSTNETQASDVSDQLRKLTAEPLTVTSGERLSQYFVDNWPLEAVPTEQTLIDGLQNSTTFMAWLLKAMSEKKLGIVKFSTIQTEYNDSMRNKLTAIDALFGGNGESLYDSPFADEQAFDSFASEKTFDLYKALYNLTNYTDAQLTTLDPEASGKLALSFLQTPVTDLITKPANATTYQADGLLSATNGYPGFFVFKDPTTPTVPTATSHAVTVHYIDDQGQTLKPDKILTGTLGDSYKTDPLTITGYKLTKTTGQESGVFSSSDQSVTYTYSKVATDKVVKNSAIYGIKKLNLYSSPTFSKSTKIATYAKKARMNRPMFKVIGMTTSKNGVKRYKVIDLNGAKKTGYITANTNYTAPLYYATKQNQVTVINPSGLNAYAKVSLTGKKIHYKQGQVLKVKAIVGHNLTTRFLLSNGSYISANKKLVIAGKYTTPNKVLTKTAVNRYGTANLTQKNRHIAKAITLKVTGYAYSNANNFRKSDTLRYKVAGGYITANKSFVRVLN